ncbi:MAG: AsmA family protein [Burkholderiales bacterium]|nr:AsmA family protein [Burkholderiales bacterium]
MKPLRLLLYAAGGVLALSLVALGAVFVIVDGDFVKARLQAAMKEKNRTLSIEGTPQVRLFPVAAIALGRTTLTEPGSERVFVALDSAEVAVRVVPLLSKEVAVEALKVAGLKVNVVRGKDGRFNFADLAGPEKPGERPRPETEAAWRVRVAEVSVEGAQLAFRDEASGQELNVVEASLKTGRLDGAQPGPVSLALRATGKNPAVDLRAQASGALRLDSARQAFGFDGFAAAAKGRIGSETLAVEFSAPKVEVTTARAQGTEVKASIQLRGPQRSLDARARLEGIQGNAQALALSALALDLEAASGGNTVKGRISTPVQGNLDARTWEMPKISANLALAGPMLPQKTAALSLTGQAKADLARQSAAFDLAAKLDDSNVRARLAATRFEPLAASFDVAIDRINLDRYLPPEDPKAKKDERVDFSALKGKTVSGKLSAGAVTVRRVKLEDVKAEVKLAGGKLEIAPHSAKLYGGTLAGAIAADANGNRIHVKETVQNVALGPLLRDAAQKDVLEGRGNVSLDVTSAGGTVTALRKALAGAARIELRDGAVKGVNLAEGWRNLRSAVGAKQTRPDPSQKTDFSELSASFAIKGGIARNDDLKGASPFLRLAGAGNLDIGNNAIDYAAKATLVATSKGQGGPEAGQVAGLTIPIRFTGALDNPDWSVDYSALVAGAGGAIGRAAGGAADAARKGAGAVGEAVRGLFRR